jgi:hypothetical protein
MASSDRLVYRLDLKLRSLHKEQSLVTKTGKTGILDQPFLSEYLRLANTEEIVPGVEFIALDALSKNFNLYEDDRERQQILAAMADELNDSAPNNILASIQIIQNLYPSIYLLGEQQLTLTRDRAIDNGKGFATIINPPTIASPSPAPNPTPTIHTTPAISQQPLATGKESQPKSGLVIGFCIVSAVIGGAIANSFSKSPNPAPTAANNPQPIATGVQASSIENNNSAPTNTVATPQTRPSPAQAIRDHYQALNARNYDLTWDNLTSRFKSESGNSSTLARKEYEDWWNSVRSIDLQRAETASISSDGSRAVVSYRHGYTMNTGRFVQDKYTHIFLVWDEGKGKWLIDRRS